MMSHRPMGIMLPPVHMILPSLAEAPRLRSALGVQGLGPGPGLGGADCPGCLGVGDSCLPRAH